MKVWVITRIAGLAHRAARIKSIQHARRSVDMPKRIERTEVLKLLAEGVQLVEVLPHEEYELEHIDGAISIPLRKLEQRAPAELDSSTPVITYCSGSL